MIPKIIHYCWLSGDPKPANVRKCIRSWKKYFPDYRIKCWGPGSFDFDSVRFTREALAARKWAFVADYIRLYALYTEGGIYLDSDVMAFGGIDGWLDYDLFTGIEKRGDTSELFVEAAVIGASKGNPTIKECLELYQDRGFRRPDGTFDLCPIPTLVTPVFCARTGWDRTDATARLRDNSIVFPSDIIANTESGIKPSVVLYHWNNRSWIDKTTREKAYLFFRRIGLLPLWNFIKSLR